MGLFIAGAILFLAAGFTMAQSRRIAVTPLNFEMTVERGEAKSDYITVLNPSYEDGVEVEMTIEDMFPEGEEGRVILSSPEEDLDIMAISRWITFEPREFSLEPREQKNVRFTVDVPENANPGGHYAGLIAGSGEAEIEGTGVTLTQRIASLVLLTVPGEMVEDLSTVDLSTSQNYYEYGPVTFSSRFRNEGTVHLRPEATITVEDLFGREVAEIPVEPRNVLPDATRRVDSKWDENRLWGIRYTATLNGVYGMDEAALNSEKVVFWAFPWKYGLAFFLIILFFIFTRKRWITILKILVMGEKALSK